MEQIANAKIKKYEKHKTLAAAREFYNCKDTEIN